MLPVLRSLWRRPSPRCQPRLAPGVAAATATAATLAFGLLIAAPAAARTRCGPRLCAEGELCCNDSCGLCAPPGGACIQPDCGWARDRAGGHVPLLDPRGPSPLASHAATVAAAWAPALGPRGAALAVDALGVVAPSPWWSLQAAWQLRDAAAGPASSAAASPEGSLRVLWLGALLHLPTGSPGLQAAIGARASMSATAAALAAPGASPPPVRPAHPAHHGGELLASVLLGRGMFGVAAHASVGLNLAAEALPDALMAHGALSFSCTLPAWLLPLALRATLQAGTAGGRADVGAIDRVGAALAVAWHHGPLALGAMASLGRLDATTVATAPLVGVFGRLR